MLALNGASPALARTASNAATEARRKLEALIERGRERAANVVEHIQQSQPIDRLPTASSLMFVAADDASTVRVRIGDIEQNLHRNALRQAAERVGLPLTYVGHLSDDARQPWGRELLSHVLTETHRKEFGDVDDRVLVRSVGGEVRGMLSDRFRRLDSHALVSSFASAASHRGAVPIEGYALDTKIAIKAILPVVTEPIPNEVLAYGVALENSDFGNGALTLRSFIIRLVCTNGLLVDNVLRQVHLGRRLEGAAFSERTLRLDTEAMVSAVGDVVRAQLSPRRVEELHAAVRAAHEQEVSPHAVEMFLKKHVTKHEADAVKEAFSSAEVVNMPAGQTTWRLAQAISWIAGKTTDEERRLDLMRTAGGLLGKAA